MFWSPRGFSSPRGLWLWAAAFTAAAGLSHASHGSHVPGSAGPLGRSDARPSGSLASGTSGPRHQRSAQDPALPRGEDPAARSALERGLAYLAARQAEEPDGSLPTREPDRVGREHRAAPIAVTALSALAYLAGGSTPGRGPYGDEVKSALGYLLSHADTSPSSPTFGFISGPGDELSRMHGHGFATLALTQAFTSPRDSWTGERLAQVLEAAVGRIEASQGSEGGWMYTPTRTVNHEASVTICMVQALRAARECGVNVTPETVLRAVDYVKRSQKEDGSFRYALGDERSSPALTAAAIATLNATGDYNGPELKSGFDYIARELAARESSLSGGGSGQVHFPYYERLYLSQAYWQRPDLAAFRSWYGAEVKGVLRSQRPDGSWASDTYGPTYATAMNCLFLALPLGLLPIFQR